ncbi:aldolase [Cadophora sp. DSE1049]|nr:aldolase [Cadophora sp. DSE1049]
MSANTSVTWLEELASRMNIDVDWMDPKYIKSVPIKLQDQTSNQIWLHMQMSDVSNQATLAAVVAQLKGEHWLAVYRRMAVLLCEKNLALIAGRVLVQTSPSDAYDTTKTLEHARLYDREFQTLGIPRNRYCIKILATGPGIVAARILQQEGISTLGTGVFSVEQAIACSQARCLYISPYYNEVRTHEDPSLWPDVDDPATQHPFSNRILQMIEVYKHLFKVSGEQQPLMKLAAFRSIKEVIAAAELGCYSATLSPTTLDELSQAMYDRSMNLGTKVLKSDLVNMISNQVPERLRDLLKTDPLIPGGFRPARTDIDYLANNGAELEKAILSDAACKVRLNDAIAMFMRAETASKTLIEGVLQRSAL